MIQREKVNNGGDTPPLFPQIPASSPPPSPQRHAPRTLARWWSQLFLSQSGEQAWSIPLAHPSVRRIPGERILVAAAAAAEIGRCGELRRRGRADGGCFYGGRVCVPHPSFAAPQQQRRSRAIATDRSCARACSSCSRWQDGT